MNSGYGVLAAGSTFSGTTSPTNWNAVVACQQACAQWLWLQPDRVTKAKPFLPFVVFAEDPSLSNIRVLLADRDQLPHHWCPRFHGPTSPPTIPSSRGQLLLR
jgi:hypothetical protein